MSRCCTALVLAATAACDEPDRGGMTVRDSAGITIVEYGPELPPHLEHWALDSAPLLDIGKVEGDDTYLFTRIVQAGALPRGEVFVADRATSELRVFDSTGRFVRRFGRNGSGPGEFQSLDWVDIDRAGSIAAYDGASRRLSRFSSDGILQQVTSLSSSPGAPIGSMLGQFGDGSILMRSFLGLPTNPAALSSGLVRDSLLLSRIAPDGASGAPVGRFPGPQNIRAVGPRLFAMEPAPFGLRTVVAVADSVFYLSSQENYEIRAYRRDGALQRVLRRRAPPQPVSPAAKAEWNRRSDERMARFKGSIPPQVLELAKYHTVPDVFPAHGEVLVDRAGNLWVEDYRPFPGRDTLMTWIVFNPEGTMLATAELPAVQITEIGAERITGVWRGDDDVPRVRVYRLARRSSGATPRQ
jgi:hypothetical protein